MTIKDFFAPLARGLDGAERRTATTLIVMMLTATTAWAQEHDPYLLQIEPNYDGSGGAVSVPVSYDGERGGYYTILSDIEEQFYRRDYHIIGYDYSSTGKPNIATNAEIELTENPTTLYAFWDDTPRWEISDEDQTLTFYGTYVMEDYDESSPWQGNSSITTIIIKEGMTAIGNNAFSQCNYLTSVSLPNSLTSIGENTFIGCSALTSIEIPSNVSEIKQAAFGSSGLTSIHIPASVTTIESYAFNQCSSLASVTVHATTPPTLEWFVFDGNAEGRKIYVPSDALNTYKNAEGWRDYADDIFPFTAIPYIDSDGNTAYRTNYRVVTDGMTDFYPDWNVVNSDVSIFLNSLEYPVNLILCDGATLTFANTHNIQGNSQLNVYGQEAGSGKIQSLYGFIDLIKNSLTINSGTIDVGQMKAGDITIRRGSLKANCLSGYAIWCRGDMVISGGSVTATSYNYNAITIEDENGGGGLTITGGQITATADGESGYGISAADGITIGWTNASDFITASSYNGTVTIAEGKAFADEDGNIYSGTISDPSVLNGKTLTPAIILMDNADNCDAIKNDESQQLSVQLQGRTLYKDGEWNTLCLPFGVSDGDATDELTFSGTPLEGATVMELDTEGTHNGDKQTGLYGNTLYLYFDEANEMVAGKPYIVKWDKAAGYDTADPATRDLKNPVFRGVTLSSTTEAGSVTSLDGKFSFKGTYDSQEYTEENKNILYLGAGNTLYYPQPTGGNNTSIGAFRAYFDLTVPAAAVRQFSLSFGEGSEETGIVSVSKESGSDGVASAWYLLDGRRLSGKPTVRGIYIMDGRKVVVK